MAIFCKCMLCLIRAPTRRNRAPRDECFTTTRGIWKCYNLQEFGWQRERALTSCVYTCTWVCINARDAPPELLSLHDNCNIPAVCSSEISPNIMLFFRFGNAHTLVFGNGARGVWWVVIVIIRSSVIWVTSTPRRASGFFRERKSSRASLLCWLWSFIFIVYIV